MDPIRVLEEVQRLLDQGFRGDLYVRAAANVLGIAEDAVTPDQRLEVKRTVFVGMYGGGPKGFTLRAPVKW